LMVSMVGSSSGGADGASATGVSFAASGGCLAFSCAFSGVSVSPCTGSSATGGSSCAQAGASRAVRRKSM
jgi:hypothetical protein